MKRRRAPRPFAPALDRAAAAVMPKTLLAEVQRVWPDAAGARLAAVATPVSERGGVVRVKCGSAVWADQLNLMQVTVVAALNRELGRDVVSGLRADARPA